MLHGTLARPRVLLRRSAATPDFWLPLNDAGAGAVNLVPGIGVGTATFTRTSSATCWGPTGLLLTVGTGVARSMYTELTGAAYLGFFSEDGRTNNCLWGRDFTNAAWVATTMTKALDQTGIDGAANSASSLLATGANATVKQTIALAAVSRPFSVFVKRLVGTGNIDLAQDGAAYTTQSVANDGAFHRVTLVASQLNPVLSIRLATSGDKIAVDYAALEDSGPAASTPIATTSATVTRNSDLLTFPGAGNVLTAQGVAYCEFTRPLLNATGIGVLSINDGGTNNRADIRLSTATISGVVSSGAAPQSNITAVGTLSAGVLAKLATRWGSVRNNVWCNAAPGADSGAVTPPAALTLIQLGGIDAGSGNNSYAGIKNFKIYKRTVSNEFINSLTAVP